MKTSTSLRALLTAGAMAGLMLIGTSPASALGSYVWNDCWGGYAGSSWYSSSTGRTNASTTRTDGCGYVGVSLRYQEAAPLSITAGSAGDYISTSRAVVAYGGWHWSRTNGAPTHT